MKDKIICGMNLVRMVIFVVLCSFCVGDQVLKKGGLQNLLSRLLKHMIPFYNAIMFRARIKAIIKISLSV